MIVKPDSLERPGFAVQCGRTGEIKLCTVSPTEREAQQLLALQREHHKHATPHRVVPVVITVAIAE